MPSASSFVDVELLVVIALAVWVLVTRPQLGPGSVPGAVALLPGVAACGWFVPDAVTAALAVPHGRYLALLGCVLRALGEPAEERVRRSSHDPF